MMLAKEIEEDNIELQYSREEAGEVVAHTALREIDLKKGDVVIAINADDYTSEMHKWIKKHKYVSEHDEYMDWRYTSTERRAFGHFKVFLFKKKGLSVLFKLTFA